MNGEIGAPRRIRTSGPQIRSLVLYPAELWARGRRGHRGKGGGAQPRLRRRKPVLPGTGAPPRRSHGPPSPPSRSSCRCSPRRAARRRGPIPRWPPAPPKRLMPTMRRNGSRRRSRTIRHWRARSTICSRPPRRVPPNSTRRCPRRSRRRAARARPGATAGSRRSRPFPAWKRRGHGRRRRSPTSTGWPSSAPAPALSASPTLSGCAPRRPRSRGWRIPRRTAFSGSGKASSASDDKSVSDTEFPAGGVIGAWPPIATCDNRCHNRCLAPIFLDATYENNDLEIGVWEIGV